MIADAEGAVDDWQQYITELIELHRGASKRIDWIKLSEKRPPSEPFVDESPMRNAEGLVASFKPSFRDIFLGGSKRRLAQLNKELEKQKQLVQTKREEARNEYQSQLTEWEEDKEFAKRVINLDTDAVNDVVKEYLQEVKETILAKRISVSLYEQSVVVDITALDHSVVPSFRLKQLASGKLSQTSMPKGEANEIYKKYLASLTIRAAADIFSILPIQQVYVNSLAPLLNKATGHIEDQTIISCFFVRPTLEALNFERLDPFEALANFVHNVSYKKTSGFAPVEQLERMF